MSYRAFLFVAMAVLAGPAEDAREAIRRGKEAFDKNDYDVATDRFSEAIRLDPKSVAALVDLARTYGRKGDYDLSLADCSAALKQDPKCVDALRCRAKDYLIEGDRARGDCVAALRINPDLELAFILRIACFGRQGKFDRVAGPNRPRRAGAAGRRPGQRECFPESSGTREEIDSAPGRSVNTSRGM